MIGKTLKTQLILIAVLPMLLTILFVSVLMLQEIFNNIEEEYETHTNNIASQAIKMSEFLFYTGDIQGMEEVADIVMKIDGLQHITFIDSTGNSLLYKSHPDSPQDISTHTFPILSAQVDIEDFPSSNTGKLPPQLLGSIEIGLAESQMLDRRYQTYIRVLLIALLSIILGTLLVFTFNRKLSSSIGNLIEASQRIEQRQYKTHCPENGTGELLQLQKTFNKMADTFQLNEKEMQDKIDNATQSLDLTVQQLSEKNQELNRQRQKTIEVERSRAIYEERTRIMRDMHDGIGGQLVASLALLEQEEETEVKKNISEVLTESLEDLRMIINSLDMDSNQLSALLADFKYRMNKKLDSLNILLLWQIADFADNITVKAESSLNLLRILQEVFTNILKHSKATKIEFDLVVIDDKVQIIISDNGHTFHHKQSESSHGIANMRYRAKRLNGNITVTQSPSGGCKVDLLIPISSF